jgi:dienelactone hydrolase
MLLCSAPASAQDETTNTAKSEERAREHQTPEYQADLRQRSVQNTAEGAQVQAADPERQFEGNVCWHRAFGCAGDVRLYDFEARGRGLGRPVLFTARNGSTISGHVWATQAGPAERPGIVITNGSIQATEQMYWWAAQTLAKAGYVVITSDPQGQGRSDQFGAGADAGEGVHSQVRGNTFYDGTQDALDFLLSTAARPFCPRESRSGTSHCDKQQRRVAEGRNAAHNPFGDLVDPERIGIAGHSYGASGVSWIAQQDTRVDGVVAWDAMCDPSAPDAEGDARCSPGGQGGQVALRVPSLNLTVDYLTGRDRKSSPPDPMEKSQASLAFSEAGIDTGSIAIRGGTHFEFSYLPSTSFRATLRGIDLSAWYTLAWFDKYVKVDPTADRRLLSPRWRTDPGDLEIDPAGQGNLFSYHYRSRLDVRRSDGTRFLCEDLRTGCPGQPASDGETDRWGYLPIATSPDGTPAYAAPDAGASAGSRLASL